MNLFSVLLILSLWAEPNVLVEGLVVAMEINSVTIKQENGSVVKIPRSAYPPIKGVRVGKDKIHVWVSPTELMKMNPKALPKNK